MRESVWWMGLLTACTVLVADDAVNPDAKRAREEESRRLDARGLGEAFLPDPPPGWRFRWDAQPLPSQYGDADEYWKDVFIPGLEDAATTEQEARDTLARAPRNGHSERQIAIMTTQGLSLEALPTAERCLLYYTWNRTLAELEPRFAALDLSAGYSIEERQKQRETLQLEAMASLDQALSDDQVRVRYMSMATLVRRRSRVTFLKCSDWAAAANGGGGDMGELTRAGVQVCEATVDIMVVDPARKDVVRDLAPGEAGATQDRLQKALQGWADVQLANTRRNWDKVEDGGVAGYQKQKALADLTKLEQECRLVRVTVQPRAAGTGSHVVGLAEVPTPLVLPFGSRCFWGPPRQVCLAWLRNGSALVQVTLEGNLPIAEMMKEADSWLSLMEARTASYGNTDGMLKTAAKKNEPPASSLLSSGLAALLPSVPPATPPSAAPAPAVAGGSAPGGSDDAMRLPPPVLAAQAGDFLAQKNYAQAEAYYLRALKAGTRASQWAVGLGDAYAAQGKGEQAVQAYRQALQMNPSDAAAHNGLGKQWFAQKRHPEAMLEFFEAARLDSRNADYIVNAAACLFEQGQVEQAKLWVRQAMANGLKDHPLYKQLGMTP